MRHRHVLPRPRARVASLLAAALLVLASTAHAHDRDLGRDRRRHDFSMWDEGRLVDVQVRVEGEPAPLLTGPGEDDRRYVQAFAGREYALVVRNTTGRRVAVVIAVDGLNVLTGDRSTLAADERKYVLDPYETATIRGWRTSLDEVRQFTFVDERRSYAERTGQANADMGWIRIASFREQRPWWVIRPERMQTYRGEDGAPPADAPSPPTTSKAAPAPLARGEAAPQGSFPGTGWGDRRDDRVSTTTFRTDPDAVDRLVIRYEYGSGLRALGVLPEEWHWRDRLAERDGGFARPPRW